MILEYLMLFGLVYAGCYVLIDIGSWVWKKLRLTDDHLYMLWFLVIVVGAVVGLLVGGDGAGNTYLGSTLGY